MRLYIKCCLFVLCSEKNENIRKNDLKKLRLLLYDGGLPAVEYTGGNIKKQIRERIAELTGSTEFHLEQVYTLESCGGADILYLGAANIESVRSLGDGCRLADFIVQRNKNICFDGCEYPYTTETKVSNGNVEYSHRIEAEDEAVRELLLRALICYKRIRASIEYTDIMFKFMASSFTIEDVRSVYNLITESDADRSNFRKKVFKYCKETDAPDKEKTGYRPSRRYVFEPDNDIDNIWV